MNTNLFAQNSNFNLIVGTYTNSCESNGIYVYEFNVNTGEFIQKNKSEKTVNPSYLAISNDNKFIYSTNENGAESTVSAFDFNSKSGKIDKTQNTATIHALSHAVTLLLYILYYWF